MKRLALLLLLVLVAIFHQQIFTWGFMTVARFYDKPPPPPPPKVHLFTVAASCPVATCFAQRIGGAHIQVVSPLPDRADAALWVPTLEDTTVFFAADLVLLNGAGFERWVNIYAPPENKTLRLADAVKDRWITGDGATNGHTWLDPQLAIGCAEALRDALVARDGAHAADYADNAARLRRDLEALDAGFKRLPIKAVFAASNHHAYLARACGWQETNFNLKASAAPTTEQLEQLHAATKAHPEIKVMLWEEPPFTEMEEQMRRLGLVCVVFPTGARALGKDYLAVMKDNLDKLRDVTR